MKPLVMLVALAIVLTPQVTAGQIRLTLDPESTEIDFVLGATLHEVHGSFRLSRGQVLYDPATGEVSGEVVVDARSGDSGNAKRDRDMHRKVLVSESHPTIVLRPSRVEGELVTEGPSDLRLIGTIDIVGSDHPVEIPVTVTMTGSVALLRAEFKVPYVEWGLKDPSKFVLRVSKSVTVTVSATAAVEAATAPPDPS